MNHNDEITALLSSVSEEYFQQRWDLKGELAAIDAIIAKAESHS